MHQLEVEKPEGVPKCTVAIPVYNRKDMIGEALESVLSQPLSGLEVLVVDDCSTDGCWDVLQKFRDRRLRLVRNEANVGLFGNFNRCLELARGDYIRILGSDDQLAEGCLAGECEFMDANPQVALVNCAATLVNTEGQPMGVSGNYLEEGVYPGRLAIAGVLWYRAQYMINPLSCLSAVLLRRSALLGVGWFDTSMRMCGDIDFLLRMMEYGDLGVLRQNGAIVKVHPQAMGYRLKYSDASLVETITIVRRYAELLEEELLFEDIQCRMAAWMVAYAVELRRKHQNELSKAYFRAALEHCAEWPRLFAGVLRFLALHFLRVAWGVQVLPGVVRRARVSVHP